MRTYMKGHVRPAASHRAGIQSRAMSSFNGQQLEKCMQEVSVGEQGTACRMHFSPEIRHSRQSTSRASQRFGISAGPAFRPGLWTARGTFRSRLQRNHSSQPHCGTGVYSASNSNLPGGKGRLQRKADNSPPSVSGLSRTLEDIGTVLASTPCYTNSFSLYIGCIYG
jgi:hypothetical protein